MRISHRNRFVFLSNPRTGSTAVGKALKSYSDVLSRHISYTDAAFPFHHHISAARLKAVFEQRGWDWSEYRHFCVTRNPFDRVVSAWHWQLKFVPHPRSGWLLNLKRWLSWRRRLERDFERFVLRLDFDRTPNLSLKRFIGDIDGTPLVETVLRFENLATELPQYLAALGVALRADDIPRANVTAGRGDYHRYYTPRTIARVRELFAWELDRFGYDI